MKRKSLFVLAVSMLAVGANAALVSWSADSFFIDKLGWDGAYPDSSYDKLTGTGKSGADIVLPGAPAAIVSHDLMFEVGLNAGAGWTPPDYTVTYNVTVGGVTKLISQVLKIKIDLTDDAELLPVSSLFSTPDGEILFTSKGWKAVSVGQTVYGQLDATLEAVPEPFTMALGLAGLGVAIARRRRKA